MKISKQDASALYGSQSKLARALQIAPAAVSRWPDDKPIPELQTLKLRFVLKPKGVREVVQP